MLTEFKNLLEVENKFADELACMDHLETIRWGGSVVSPFQPGSKVYKCKPTKKGNRYKCKETGKYFNALTGTIFEDTKIPLKKWFMALYIFSSHKKGISSHQLGKDLGITQKSAWFVLHRLRYAFDHAGHGSMQFPEQNVFCMAGFSEKVFSIMKLLEQDRKALINEVKKIEL